MKPHETIACCCFSCSPVARPVCPGTERLRRTFSALVAQVNAGAGDAVREQLPALLSEHPNDPGVLYLQALLTREGADAVRTYQSIVDNFPKNEWADDALFKVYQFYYALGLYRTADLKMDQLKAEYPASPYCIGAAAGADRCPGRRPRLTPEAAATPANRRPTSRRQGCRHPKTRCVRWSEDRAGACRTRPSRQARTR